MDFLAGTLFGFSVEYIVLISLFILSAIFEHRGRFGISLFVSSVLIFVLYKTYTPNLNELWKYLLLYFPLGILWSLWRYKKFVAYKVSLVFPKSKGMDDYEKSQLKVGNNVDKVLNWVIFWPVSIVESITGDVIDALTRIITVYLKSVYDKILNSELDKLK